MNLLDIRDNLPTPLEQIERLKNILSTNYGNLYIFNWKTDIEGLLISKEDTLKLEVYSHNLNKVEEENLNHIIEFLLDKLIDCVIKECNRREVYRVNILPDTNNVIASYLIPSQYKEDITLSGVVQFYYDEN